MDVATLPISDNILNNYSIVHVDVEPTKTITIRLPYLPSAKGGQCVKLNLVLGADSNVSSTHDSDNWGNAAACTILGKSVSSGPALNINNPAGADPLHVNILYDITGNSTTKADWTIIEHSQLSMNNALKIVSYLTNIY